MFFVRSLTFVLFVNISLCVAQQSRPDLQSLIDSGDWFQLRSAVDRSETPDFYRGAVACAFHDIRRAEKHFQRVIKAGVDRKQSAEAHGQLAYMYLRTGQYKKTYEHLSAMQRLNPEAPGVNGALYLFSALNQYPELSVARRRFSRVKMIGEFFIPLTVQGKSAAYGFDTGMNLSIMSESEASRLGLEIHDASSFELQDGASGKSVPIRFAILERLSIGGFELRHVAFSIIPSDAMPFREWPSDRQGILGLPVLLSLRTMRWTGDSTLEIGFPTPRRRPPPNLCFQAATPVAEGSYRGRKINVWIDTGASKSYLTQRFAREFPDVIKDVGTKNMVTLRGIGGAADVEVVTLSEFAFDIGGSTLTVRPIEVLAAQKNVDRAFYQMWLGMDVLGSVRSASIDFKAMAVKIEPPR